MRIVSLVSNWTDVRARTPTALPKKKRATHRAGKELAKDARIPNSDVRNSVALNAVVRPSKSEPATKLEGNTAQTWREIRTSTPSDSPKHHPCEHRRGKDANIGIRDCRCNSVSKRSENIEQLHEMSRRGLKALTREMLLYSRQYDSNGLHPHLDCSSRRCILAGTLLTLSASHPLWRARPGHGSVIEYTMEHTWK